MKRLTAFIFQVATSVLAFAADNPKINGNWNVHNNVAGNESDSVCTFTQKDSDLTGTCKNENGEGQAVGKVDGTKVSWSYESEYNGSPLTLKYSGTLDEAANKITGTLSVVQFGVDGEFTATLAK